VQKTATNKKTNVKEVFEMEQLEKYQSALDISFTAGKIAKFFSAIALILFLAHCMGMALKYLLPEQHLTAMLNRFFDLGEDANVPTLFSSFLLLTASIVLFYIYKQKKGEPSNKKNSPWLVLSLIFLFLTFDESAGIHEELMETVRNRIGFKLSPYFYSPWTIPYAFFVLAVVIYFLKFVLNLPKKTRNLIFISGFIYVTGAMGFEMLESYEEFYHGKDFIVYAYETVEEMMEMGGIILFIYTLLSYLGPHGIKIKILYRRFRKQ
jgi:hypothetical protein